MNERPEVYRFLVFAGSDYYPSGGWEDFKGAYPSEYLAIEAIARLDLDSMSWAQVVDLDMAQAHGVDPQQAIVWTK